MVKKIFILLCIFFTTLAVQAYEDCIITSDGEITNIKIQDNTIVEVYPLVTVMNEKNILMVHPLKIGETKICFLKNGKDLINFDIRITKNKTVISKAKGLEIFTLDTPDKMLEIDVPDEHYEIDSPPLLLMEDIDG